MSEQVSNHQPIPFKAETRQLLNILIHSLYSEREIFMRELISNASDALTRINYEMLTNRDVLDPDAELAIWITFDAQAGVLSVRDTGIGMNRDELIENLGTIAHSGAKAFIQAAESTGKASNLSDVIGQFGVGFYSAFMVADSIRVESRSHRNQDVGAVWTSAGENTYTVEPADIPSRGTRVTIKLKEDAQEFLEPARIREIVKRHSDFIPYPIYVGESNEQANQQTALWRKSTREIAREQAHEFYRQFALDFTEPIAYSHLNIDAPVQLYALLYVPASPEKNIFSARKEDGLKLYARKVLIQEYCRDLLPDYLRFFQGVVDSEDIPLNVSRETVQASRIIPQLRKIVTNKAFDLLQDLNTKAIDDYAKFWKEYHRYLKEGIATDKDSLDQIAPLLRFSSLNHSDSLIGLDQYLEEMKPEQAKIFYLLGDDPRALLYSPHLELYRKQNIDVLLLSDPIDPFVLLALTEYKEKNFANATTEKPDGPTSDEKETQTDTLPQTDLQSLMNRIKNHLGEKVESVRATDRLYDSPIRLVDVDGAIQQEVQKVYRLLNKEYDIPQKILEVNPSHEIIKQLNHLPEGDSRFTMVVDQMYENALLIEGLHPDPTSMVSRIQKLLTIAIKNSPED